MCFDKMFDFIVIIGGGVTSRKGGEVINFLHLPPMIATKREEREELLGM